jgi:hypothetical protein
MRLSHVYFAVLFFFAFVMPSVNAQDSNICETVNTACLNSVIPSTIEGITEPRWRDFANRDYAIATAFDGDIDGAVEIIMKIENPDTKAMAIRATGMALAIHKDLSDVEYRAIFKKLDGAAATIDHEGARDIAYTYIAMAQAFAGLDQDATETTKAMVKPELKYKAFGETAEIQAQRGDFEAAMRSISMINSTAFKNKALGLVSNIFLKQDDYDRAFEAASQITNPTKKAGAYQKILDAQLGLESYER